MNLKTELHFREISHFQYRKETELLLELGFFSSILEIAPYIKGKNLISLNIFLKIRNDFILIKKT